MSPRIMRLLGFVGLLQLTFIPSCGSESRINPLFGSRMVPDCRPGEYYQAPHDEYCEMYYECEDQEVATEKTCDPGFLYYCQLEICFPISAETDISEICCEGLVTRDPLPETTPIIPTVQTIATPTLSTITPPTSPMVPECRREYYKVPHDEYCEMYYECEDQEVATEKTCYPGFLYHCQLEICFPVSAETDISEICCEGLVTRDPFPQTTPIIPTGPTIIPPTSPGQTSTGTPPGSTSTGTSPVTEIPVECPPLGQYFLPNPDDCSKYIRCVGGLPTFQECPGCNLFDINRLQCVGYNSAECLKGTRIPPYDPAVCSGCSPSVLIKPKN